MRVLDNVKYTAAQLTDTTYTLTLVTGFNEMPETLEFSMYIKSDGGQASVIGTRSGTTFTIVEYFDDIPTFTTNIEIYSAYPAEMVNRRTGRGFVLAVGQSNMVGKTIGNGTIPVEDYLSGHALQYAYSKAGVDDGVYQAIEPLYHPTNSLEGTANVSHMPYFAKELRQDGWKEVVIYPGAANTTGFPTHWGPTGTYFELARDGMIQALNESDDNDLICIVLRLGETNNDTGTLRADYLDAVIELVDGFRTEIGTGTNRDLSRVPFICIGLNQEFIDSVRYNGEIELAHADVPDNILYSYGSAYPGWRTHTGWADRLA